MVANVQLLVYYRNISANQDSGGENGTWSVHDSNDDGMYQITFSFIVLRHGTYNSSEILKVKLTSNLRSVSKRTRLLF